PGRRQRPPACPSRPTTPTRASAATTRVRAGVGRSSRSVTGRLPKRGTRKEERGTSRAGSNLEGAVPRSAFPLPRCFGTTISAVPSYVSPMPLRLAEHPEHDRPRERFWAVGAAALTAQELLAILLGTGCAGRDALAVAGEVLARVEGSLRRLAGRPSADLARVPGVGRGKAARVIAALELGRRVGAEHEPPPERIRGPGDVQRFYASRLRDLAVEEFHVMA